jgi:hypothetical protein
VRVKLSHETNLFIFSSAGGEIFLQARRKGFALFGNPDFLRYFAKWVFSHAPGEINHIGAA